MKKQKKLKNISTLRKNRACKQLTKSRHGALKDGGIIGNLLFLLTFLGFIFQGPCLLAQEHTCALPSCNNSESSLMSSLAGIDFFSESACDPIYLKCNYVIINRDDGTGNMPVDSDVWTAWETMFNERLANIVDNNDCSGDENYPYDSNIRVKFEVHSIDNTSAWDWYAEANADNYPSSSNPNSPYICPRFDSSWTGLEDAMTAFEANHPGEINFFFIENGELVTLLEEHLENDTEPETGYLDRFQIARGVDKGLASGCSVYPNPYYSTLSENSYVISHTYSDYLIRNNFHHVWWPQYADNSSAEVWSWSFYGKPLLFMHEMGHNLLETGHTSQCSNRHLMTNKWGTRTTHLTKSDLNKLHRNIATTDLHNAVDCEMLSEGVCSIEVFEDETIDEPMSVFGDLIIKQGVTLTITSEVYLSKYSDIIVEANAKLIVDGGTLTTSCNETWKGIKVYGGNSDFDVKFTNGATIEKTRKSAVSMFAPEPWPGITEYGNGILHADNTTFNDTRRAVAFMSWIALPNSSYIRNCTQNGGHWSISNWNCQGIEIKDNVFNDITKDCIVTESGSFTITGNEFNSTENDILFNNVSAGISTLIETNTFKGAHTGYRARGTTFAQNQIWKNEFQAGLIDVFNDGHNSYDLGRNNINSTFGSVSVDNGAGIADVHNNEFSGNLIGAVTNGNNSDYNFYLNCFNTDVVDVFIQGNVSPLIHNNIGTADNCFTHQGNSNSSTQDIGGAPAPFTYLEPLDLSLGCRDAVLAHPNVNRVLMSTNSGLPECGSDSEGDGFKSYCNPGREPDDVLEAYSWLQNKIEEIDDDASLEEDEKASLRAVYLRCYWRVVGIMAEEYVKEGSFSEARGLYQSETSLDAKVSIFSTYIMENDLESANVYLNSITDESELFLDFKTIQNINLNRLPYGPFYETSPSELNVVKNIALKSHPYAAYGKSLYYVLTGEVLSSEIPTIFQEEAELKDASIVNELKRADVYPNPFDEYLTIDLLGYDEVDIRITDFSGRLVYHSNSDDKTNKINTSNWNIGVYIVIIKNDGESVLQKKVVLLK